MPTNDEEKDPAPREIGAPSVSIERRSSAPGSEAAAEKSPSDASAAVAPSDPTEVKPVEAPADESAKGSITQTVPLSSTQIRKLTQEERREEKKRGRRAEDSKAAKAAMLPLPIPIPLAVPSVAPGTRTENVIAVFLLGVLTGCAGIWIEHNRCPGALKTAALAGAPLSIGLAVPIAAFLAWTEKGVARAVRTRRAVLFSVWAAAAAVSLSTAGLLTWNERGVIPTPVSARCFVARRETVPAPEAGVQDWIVVVSCSDRMSLVRIDVDREKWWTHEPGSTVDASLLRGRLGFDWVADVPELGPPKRSL